jgi:uroporphyrin-III C-methyltransferase / precorrin-2 dehydrogenase / sirohydrochlorin ferrochelatase
VTIQPIPTATAAGRMEPLARLPIFLALDGKRAVLAGGNAAAAWKAELLSAASARVDVYAEHVSDELRAVAADPPGGLIALHTRVWTAQDIEGAAVAVGAFAEDASAAVFAAAARQAGVPVNIIDKPALSDFAFGAIVNRSPLVIGISTDGAAPVFAQAIRAKIETLLPKGFAVWAAAAQSWRPAVVAAQLTFAARCKFWRLFTKFAMIHAGREPVPADFDSLLAEVQEHGPAAGEGAVTVVSVAAGDPESLTLRAVRALQSADIILFDDFVSRDVLDFARREARKLLVGKAASDEDAVDALMRGLARAGKRVVRLKGNDGSCVSSTAAPAASATRNGAAA